jgi:hypothetical protein
MIFISYSWADAPATHELHRRLTLSGCETWIDFERLDLQSDIRSQLARAVQDSRVVVLMDTPSAQASAWTRFEVDCAEKARIPVTRILPQHVAGDALALLKAK